MRRVGFAVPEAALTTHARMRLAQATKAQGGVWLSAEDGMRASTAGQWDWPLRVPFGAAMPLALGGASGAAGQFQPGPGGRAMLCLTPGQNGGYGDAEPLRPMSLWSAAVIWSRCDTPAKTLLALRGTQRQDNYVFLSEDEPGLLVLRDNSGGLRIEARLAEAKSPGWSGAVISVAKDGLALRPFGRPVQRAAGLDGLPQLARLLVGCRAPRAGLPKSLGSGRISDLLYWPGVDLLDGDAGAAFDLSQAFDAFCSWEL